MADINPYLYDKLRTGANLVLKVLYEADVNKPEKDIGYVANFTFNVIQGQRPIFTVDSPFPQEIAQGITPSMVQGTMTIFMPRGSDPVTLGLVPPQVWADDKPLNATSKYLHFLLYDRRSGELAHAVRWVKVLSWHLIAQSRSVVQVNLQFQGMFYNSGTA